jgi:hypothetical protein
VLDRYAYVFDIRVSLDTPAEGTVAMYRKRREAGEPAEGSLQTGNLLPPARIDAGALSSLSQKLAW